MKLFLCIFKYMQIVIQKHFLFFLSFYSFLVLLNLLQEFLHMFSIFQSFHFIRKLIVRKKLNLRNMGMNINMVLFQVYTKHSFSFYWKLDQSIGQK